jgi:DNA-directed RNA polymerase specialized sigma24 family protein
MQEVTIAEAAKRLGMSIDSIRRRIAKEELKAHKVPSPHGEIYMIELPDDIAAPPAAEDKDKEDNPVALEAMRKTIAILENELEARRREVQELHVLLQQAQKQLPPGKTEEKPAETVKEEAPKKVSWWQRMFGGKRDQVS